MLSERRRGIAGRDARHQSSSRRAAGDERQRRQLRGAGKDKQRHQHREVDAQPALDHGHARDQTPGADAERDAHHLAHAEAELGVSDWIDPETGEQQWLFEATIDLVDGSPALVRMDCRVPGGFDTHRMQREFRWASPVDVVTVLVPQLLARGIDPFGYDLPLDGFPQAADLNGPSNEPLSDAFLEEMEALNLTDVDSLLAAIGEHHVSARGFAQKIGRSVRNESSDEQLAMPMRGDRTDGIARSTTGIHVEGLDDVLVRLSRCCTPVPGDDIIGFVAFIAFILLLIMASAWTEIL